MSILIKGMEMPTSCADCRVRLAVGCFGNLPHNTRMPNCPVGPVPPHGRLIDADAMILRVNMHGTNKFGMLDEDIRQFIADAPIIIPEEGE